MEKYEELYKYAQSVFDYEHSRFSRIEDKAGRFLTLLTSLLAVYALIGRQLFGDILPPKDMFEAFIVLMAFMVLLSLLFSWWYAFYALKLQGINKAPLNDEVLSFFHEQSLVNIYYSMSKRYSQKLEDNIKINDLKASRVEKSFKSIVATVVFLVVFLIASAINTATSKQDNIQSKTTIMYKPEVQIESTNVNVYKKELEMTKEEQSTTQQTQTSDKQSDNNVPDLDIEAPDFILSTESFDPLSSLKNLKDKSE